MDSNLNNFGERLRGLIASHKLSNDDAVAGLGISRATLFNWFKRDAPPPSKEHQEKLAEFFHEPREYILYGRAESKNPSPRVQTEEHAPYGNADLLRREARKHYDYIIAAAGEDPIRLGWVIQQMREHLRKPDSWEEPETTEQILARLGLPKMQLPQETEAQQPKAPRGKSDAA